MTTIFLITVFLKIRLNWAIFEKSHFIKFNKNLLQEPNSKRTKSLKKVTQLMSPQILPRDKIQVTMTLFLKFQLFPVSFHHKLSEMTSSVALYRAMLCRH